jgi:hypothetical protein
MNNLDRSLRHRRSHKFWNTYTWMFKLYCLHKWGIGMTVIFEAVSLPENIQNMNMIVHAQCALTHEACLPIFLRWGRHYKQCIPRHLRKLYSPEAQPQQCCSSTSHCPWLFGREIPRSVDRKKRTNCVVPRSPELTLLDFVFHCVKEQVYNQSVNTRMNS